MPLAHFCAIYDDSLQTGVRRMMMRGTAKRGPLRYFDGRLYRREHLKQRRIH